MLAYHSGIGLVTVRCCGKAGERVDQFWINPITIYSGAIIFNVDERVSQAGMRNLRRKKFQKKFKRNPRKFSNLKIQK